MARKANIDLWDDDDFETEDYEYMEKSKRSKQSSLIARRRVEEFEEMRRIREQIGDDYWGY